MPWFGKRNYYQCNFNGQTRNWATQAMPSEFFKTWEGQFVVYRGMEKRNMWCDQAKSVWSQSYSSLSFLLDCNKHLQSYILQKTPLKLNDQFKSYQQLKSFQNKRKQKEILPLFGYISKSIFPTSDWFCLITSHMSLSETMIAISTMTLWQTVWWLLTKASIILVSGMPIFQLNHRIGLLLVTN